MSEGSVERVQAVLLAGDRGYSRTIRGGSKAFVEVSGRPMLIHVLEALLHTPEVSEVYVVGDAIRLEKAIAEHGCLLLAAARGCPIHVVPQRNTLTTPFALQIARCPLVSISAWTNR